MGTPMLGIIIVYDNVTMLMQVVINEFTRSRLKLYEKLEMR